jgi:hypothetical protein
MPALKCLPVDEITSARALSFTVQAGEHFVQLAPEGWVHGVQRLRAIEHEMRDVVLLGQGEALHGEP